MGCGKMSLTLPNQTALYCRTAGFCEFAIQRQKWTLRAYAKEHNLKNPVFYVDNGFHGRGFDHRPDFCKMNDNILNGLVKRVVAISLSRIGRDLLDTTEWLWSISELGIDFIDLQNPEGIYPHEVMTDTILAIAQRQS